MDERRPPEPLPDLPPDLASLDAELRELRIHERPSFSPELEGELRRVAALSPPEGRRRGGFRRTLAAAAGLVLFVALTVPPARASLVRAGATLVRLVASSSPPAPVEERAAAATPERASSPAPATAPPEEVPPPPPERPGVAAPPYRPPPVSLPQVLDPGEAQRLMRRYYPRALLRSGVGGTVRLLLWVDTAGAVDHVQVRRSSGREELDAAALAAAPHLRFRPATRDGTPVGTWVEFPLTFAVVSAPALDTIPVASDSASGPP